MAPLLSRIIPRMHFFEVDDQSWFPPLLRKPFQDSLTTIWNVRLPGQTRSPAQVAASVLTQELGDSLSEYTVIEYCAGGGGPTPVIETAVNTHMHDHNLPSVDFVLTDLHPNIKAWEKIASTHPHITFESDSVDACKTPDHLFKRADGKKVMRMFNLSFHHFDDPLAKAILQDTVETSGGFVIFELQDRSFTSLVADVLFILLVILAAPFYARKWRSWVPFVFTWLIPVLPLALLWDGVVSSLRTREPLEVEALLMSCKADTSEWEMSSGRERLLWPEYLSWVICKRVEKA